LAGAPERETLNPMSPTSPNRGYAIVAIAGLVVATGAVIISLLGGAAAEDSGPALSPRTAGFEAVVERALPSVVEITSDRGLGSGVVLDDAGHVVTNAHVVGDSRRFRVTLADGTRHAATLRGTFPAGDLAVVTLRGARPRPAVFADSSRLRVGAYALAIGNPLGLRSSVTQGIVSSTGRTVPEGGGVALPSVIQTSAPINPGNSGGALVDATGAVIGIPTLAALDPEMGGAAADGIGFAISSNTVRSIASQLVAHGRVEHSGRAWLGLGLRAVPAVGVIVASADRHGPASAAGVRPGDVIVGIGSRPARSVDDIAGVLARSRPGRRITLALRSSNGRREVEVTLGEIPPS
jgi:putative serine protease PepD